MFTEMNHLQELIDKKTQVTIFLMNGVQLRGTITGHDQTVIRFYADGRNQMIYKHAISTIESKVVMR